jgi:DNA-binding XRE family transcriptional regulator
MHVISSAEAAAVLKAAREQVGFSGAKCAATVGVTRQFWRKMETTGQVPLNRVRSVVELLDLGPAVARQLLERAGVDVDFVAAIAKQTSGSASE